MQLTWRMGLAALFLAALLTSSVRAELTWQSREISFKPKLGDKDVSGEFKFQNTGKEVVTISSVKPSCDCTTATIEKTVYKPGEEGAIKVHFTIGEKQHLQEKTVLVSTDDKSEQNVRLLMKIYIPSVFSIEPPFLFWSQGDKELKPQTVVIKNTTDKPVKVLAASLVTSPTLAKAAATQPNLLSQMNIQLEIVRDGWEYKLTLKPKDTSRPRGFSILLKTDLPETGPQYLVHAVVRPTAWAAHKSK